MALDRALGAAPGLFLIGAQSVAIPVFGGTALVLPVLSVPLLCNGQPAMPGAGSAGRRSW